MIAPCNCPCCRQRMFDNKNLHLSFDSEKEVLKEIIKLHEGIDNLSIPKPDGDMSEFTKKIEELRKLKKELER